MGTRTAIAALAVVATLGPWSHARGNNAIGQKVRRIQAQTSMAQATWRATRTALNSLRRNKPLRAALGAKGDVFVLGERSGAYKKASIAYAKSLNFGLSGFEGYLPVKVKWKEQLVFGSKGLQVRMLKSYSKPTNATVKAFQADLDAQFAKKPSTIRMPDLKIKHGPYSDMHVVESHKARLGFFGFGTRLKAEQWGHVTPAQVESTLKIWADAP